MRIATPGICIALLCAGPCLAAGAGPDATSHYRDYSINAERDLPITCKPGDVQPFAGKTMSEVFGDAWPQQPEPQPADAHQGAEVLSVGRLTPPRGLEGQAGVAVIAVLVDASGKMLDAQPICVTSMAYAIAAKRALRNAHFKPAIVNGQAVTSVVAPALVFKAGKPAGDGRSSSDDSGG